MGRFFRGCAVAVFGAFVLFLVFAQIACCIQERANKTKQERIALELDNQERQRKLNDIVRQENEEKTIKQHEMDKEEQLKLFALSEAPKIWSVSQQMKAAIAEQDGRIQELRNVLLDFGRKPEDDDDYKAICGLRDEMAKSLGIIRNKLEEAYLASCKFKAMPDRVEYSEIMRKAIEDGIDEAEATSRRYDAMKKEK